MPRLKSEFFTCKIFYQVDFSHKKGRLAHGEMLNEARLKIPCRSCRMEEPQSITQPAFNELQVCSLCRQTICRKCIRRPCATLVEQFMSKFTKEFGRN
jgi:hypothetical protein